MKLKHLNKSLKERNTQRRGHTRPISLKDFMGTVYEDMDADIRAFDVYELQITKLVKVDWVENTKSYDHTVYHLHHYIKAQQYKHNMAWFKKRGIKEKLILLPPKIHYHLEDPIGGLSELDFLLTYKIPKRLLLFNKSAYEAEEKESEVQWLHKLNLKL